MARLAKNIGQDGSVGLCVLTSQNLLAFRGDGRCTRPRIDRQAAFVSLRVDHLVNATVLHGFVYRRRRIRRHILPSEFVIIVSRAGTPQTVREHNAELATGPVGLTLVERQRYLSDLVAKLIFAVRRLRNGVIALAPWRVGRINILPVVTTATAPLPLDAAGRQLGLIFDTCCKTCTKRLIYCLVCNRPWRKIAAQVQRRGHVGVPEIFRDIHADRAILCDLVSVAVKYTHPHRAGAVHLVAAENTGHIGHQVLTISIDIADDFVARIHFGFREIGFVVLGPQFNSVAGIIRGLPFTKQLTQHAHDTSNTSGPGGGISRLAYFRNRLRQVRTEVPAISFAGSILAFFGCLALSANRIALQEQRRSVVRQRYGVDVAGPMAIEVGDTCPGIPEHCLQVGVGGQKIAVVQRIPEAAAFHQCCQNRFCVRRGNSVDEMRHIGVILLTLAYLALFPLRNIHDGIDQYHGLISGKSVFRQMSDLFHQ